MERFKGLATRVQRRQAREGAHKALNVVVSAAMVLALVPADAVPALAEELEALSEVTEQVAPEAETQAVEIADEATPLASGEQEEGPAPTNEPAPEESAPEEAPATSDEQVTEAAPQQQVQAAPKAKSAKKGPLKAPAPSAVTVTYSFGSGTSKDGVYQKRVIKLKATPASTGVTLKDCAPIVSLTYRDLDAASDGATASQVVAITPWTVASDGLSATCECTAGFVGTIVGGTISGIETSAGTQDKVSFSFSEEDCFKVAGKPTIAKVWLKDSAGNWVMDEGGSERLDLVKALKDDTVAKPIAKDAKTIVVRAYGLLDTKETIATSTKNESKSYARLVGEGGAQRAIATFKQVEGMPGVFEATFTRQNDNEVNPDIVTGSTGPLPEGPIGVEVVAKDKFGTQLTTTIDGSPYDFGLVAAALKNAGGDTKADGSFIIDGGAPVITFAEEDGATLNYPHDQAVIKAGESVEGLPAEAAKVDVFDKAVKIVALVTDNNLDTTASTVDGLTFKQVLDAGTAGMTAGGATYKLKNLSDPLGVQLEITYPDGIYALPKIVAKDYLNTVTYDPAADLGGAAEQFIVDATTPEVTAATVGATPVSSSKDANNRVYFFKTSESAPLTVYLKEQGGIKSVSLSADGYTLGSTVQTKLDELNKKMVDASFDGVYELQVIDKLAEGNELSDSMKLTVTDFAGNKRTWSFTEMGTKQAHTEADATETSNEDALYDALGGTPFEHPTILIEDDTAPDLQTLAIDEDRTDPAQAGYERFFDAPQTLSFKVVESNLRYLRKLLEGSYEGGTNLNQDYVGLEPGRQVITIARTAPDGTAQPNQTVTVADLTCESNGVYTLSRTLSAEGTYQIKAKVIDAAGNESAEKTIETFTIDTTSPVITVDWDPADSAAVNGMYFGSNRSVDITVEEANFDPNLFELIVTNGYTPSDFTPFAYDPTAWADNGDGTYTYTLNLDTDGRYSVALSGKDKAGNAATYEGDDLGYATDWFTIDTEAPVIGKYVNSKESYDPADLVVVMPEPTGEYAGANYYNSILDLTVKVKDRNFNTEDTKLDGAKATWTAGERDADGYITYETTKSYSADGEYQTPLIEAIDMVENTSDNSAEVRSFVIDLQAPTIKVSANRNPVTQGSDGGDPYNFYNGATTLTITVSDAHALKDVKLQDPDGYTASWDKNPLGEKQVTGTVPLREYGSAADEFDRAIILTATDVAGNQRTWSIDHNGTVTQVEGPGAANASINDNGEHPMLLVKDTTAPVVGLTGATAGEYYNTPQTVTATVNELLFNYLQQFDPSRVIVTVTKYEGSAGRAMSSYTIPASSFTGSQPNYSYSETFSSDGHYVVTAQFKDYAENPSNTATIGEFTIDMTPPQLTMEFDNNDVRNDKYYKATRTATITVVEHNFDPSLFTIETTGSIGGWSDNGDTHTCTVFFGEGGPYTVKVNGKDLAGNEATEVSEPEFIVDLTAPEIEIAGTAQRLGYVGDAGELVGAYHDTLEDKNAYNGVVVPTITYKDNEVLSANDLGHALAGSKHGEEVEHESAMSEEGKEMTVTLRDLGYTGDGAGDGSNWEDFYVDDYAPDGDDIYTISATMTDQAGNEAEAELTFSVNRYGSNYDVELQGMSDEELDEYERSGMLSEAPTIVVREVNVSGVADRDKDGNFVADNHHVEKEFANATTAISYEATDGAAGYDIRTVDPKRAENGWSEYVYTVRSANFGEGSDSDHNDRGQGVYRVNVMSDDVSSNANTTADFWRSDAARTQVTAAGATAEFVLDELAPAIDELDLPEGFSRGEEYQASFHVTDDITSGNTVEVEVDGQKLDASQVHGASNGTGTFTFTIPAKAFNWHRSVKITVTDYAGRSVSERNPGWAWQSTFIPEGMTVAGAVAVAVAGIVYARKRREAAEPELPA